MQQRQYRPGDVLDDYCPRERRVTDHAIVAMVESEILRTRCVVCDAEHVFKNAKVPAPRKKGSSSTSALFTQVLDNIEAPPTRLTAPGSADAAPPATGPPEPPPPDPNLPIAAAEDQSAADRSDERPFRRSLIRAQLPRPEGQAPPTRAIPEFTMHQPLNQRPRRGGGRFRRHPGGAGDFTGPMRSSRPANPGQGPANGNGSGNGQGGRRRRRKKH